MEETNKDNDKPVSALQFTDITNPELQHNFLEFNFNFNPSPMLAMGDLLESSGSSSPFNVSSILPSSSAAPCSPTLSECDSLTTLPRLKDSLPQLSFQSSKSSWLSSIDTQLHTFFKTIPDPEEQIKMHAFGGKHNSTFKRHQIVQRRQSYLELKDLYRLRLATAVNNIDEVRTLLMMGIDPNKTDSKSRTPLHIASAKGYSDVVKLLLQYGADPNKKDTVGNTPFHLAACIFNIPCIVHLMRAGTDLSKVDTFHSPIRIALSRLSLLKAKGDLKPPNNQEEFCEVFQMLKEYVKCFGTPHDINLIETIIQDYSNRDPKSLIDNDIDSLLHSLEELDLSKSKVA